MRVRRRTTYRSPGEREFEEQDVTKSSKPYAATITSGGTPASNDLKNPFGWLLGIVAAALLLCAFPIYQAALLGIPIVYTNGVDESSYLQYDYSRYVTEYAGVGRISQYLVNVLHEAGFGGGQINLLFDLVAVFSVLILVPIMFRRAGFSTQQSRLGALLWIVSPLVVSPLNPVVEQIVDAVEGSSLRFWAVVPPFPEFPLLRSPEPQFSVVLVLVALCLGMRRKIFWPAVAVLPFLYVFIGVPLALGVAAWVFRKRLRWPEPLAWIGAFVVVGAGLLLFSFCMHEEVGRFTGTGHRPIVPVVSVAALIVSFGVRSLDGRNFLRMASIATIFAVNIQLIAGWFLQPSNYDQYAGLLILGGALTVLLMERFSFRALRLGAAAAYAVAAVVLFSDGYRVIAPVLGESAIWETPARSLVVRSLRLASWLNLVSPRQEPTLLSVTGAYGRLIDRFGEEFRCVRSVLGQDRERDPDLKRTFHTLDVLYGTNNTDYFRNHLGNPRQPAERLSLSPQHPERCRPKAELTLK
jgi:hypothetical protein